MLQQVNAPRVLPVGFGPEMLRIKCPLSGSNTHSSTSSFLPLDLAPSTTPGAPSGLRALAMASVPGSAYALILHQENTQRPVFSARASEHIAERRIVGKGKPANRNEGLPSEVLRRRLKRLARATTAARSGYGRCVVRWRCRVCVGGGAKVRCQRVLKIPAYCPGCPGPAERANLRAAKIALNITEYGSGSTNPL